MEIKVKAWMRKVNFHLKGRIRKLLRNSLSQGEAALS